MGAILAGDHGIGSPLRPCTIDHLGPAVWFPKLFFARRTRVKNDKRIVDLSESQKLAGFVARGGRQFHMESAGSAADPERLQHGQIVIEGVQLFEPAFCELVVNPGPIF